VTVCRLLAVTSDRPVDVGRHLDAFAALCRESSEYQGHGWGCAVWRGTRWERHRSLTPVWEDAYRPRGEVRTFVAHARSAFRDEGIEVGNNMPFLRGDRAFIFNGELSGVRLGVEGRTGAEKIFSLIGQMDRGDLSSAISRSVSVLKRRSSRIRACNFIVAEPGTFHVHSLFDGEAAYFTLFKRTWNGETVLCSGMYPTDQGEWVPVANGSQEAVPCSF
jgi:hypothetical protein